MCPVDMNIHDVAMQLHDNGASVFPVPHGEKSPKIKWKQFQNEKPTKSQLNQWFGDGELSNIAIVTGEVSGIVVVDTDTTEAKKWVEANLPATPLRVTTANGTHYYYGYPHRRIRNRVKITTATGILDIDVRGDGGYVIGPGSKHPSGAVYEPCDTFFDQQSWVSLPQFQLDWIEFAKASASDAVGAQGQSHAVKRARAYLEKVPGAIEGQGGDTHTYVVACKLVRGFALSKAEALPLLMQWNEKCVPRWSENELEEKLTNAEKYGAEQAGGMLNGFAEQSSAGTDMLAMQYGQPITRNKDGEPSNLNQLYISAKFADDNRILHEPVINLFYVYENESGLWQRRTDASLVVDLGNALLTMLRDHGASALLKLRTEHLLSQILRLLRGVVEKPDVFQGQRMVIHVGNGVLHLDAKPPTLNEFSPEYYSRNRSEIPYDEDAECPRFINELLCPALDCDDIILLQKYAGQCLLGRNPSQKLLLLRGTPGGGKSSLVNVLESVIGMHNVAQLRVRHLSERSEIAGFVGKTLLCGKDVPGDFLNTSSAHVLKSLVGGDRLDAEQKNMKHRFEITGEFNVIITSNSRLHIKLDADSGAWRRRLLIVDYDQPAVRKPIPNFDKILIETEGPGILNWCIAGAFDLLEELKSHGHFVVTESQSKRIEALLCESDSVRHFVLDRIVTRKGADVTVQELQMAYQSFCDEHGWQAVTVRQFENQIPNIMLELHRSPKRTDIKRPKSQRGFAHVALKEGRDG